MIDKPKRKSPYQYLLDEFRAYAYSVTFRKTVKMWTYPKARIGEAWTLRDLHERVQAAAQLGYDVILEADDNGLHVKYRQQVPNRPWRVA